MALGVLVYILLLALQQFSSKRTAQAFFTFGSFFAVDQYLSQLCTEYLIDYKSEYKGLWEPKIFTYPHKATQRCLLTNIKDIYC